MKEFIRNVSVSILKHFESRGTIYSYLNFGLKPAVFHCFTNAIAPPPIALESCSRAQTDWSLLDCTWKKIFGWGLRIFFWVTS